MFASVGPYFTLTSAQAVVWHCLQEGGAALELVGLCMEGRLI